MASIEEIIQRAVNPFDTISARYGNFWSESQNPKLTVNSIHQEAIEKIESVLDCIARDNRIRTILLDGDSGSGKSYLLGRLKQQLNSKAFFAYIGFCSDSEYIVRHILWHTVDSLMRVPEGRKLSQLLLWFKSLSVFKKRGAMKKLLTERNLFIRSCNQAYPTGIYNPNKFFGVLYDLTQPELHHLACQWFKGDDLDEESLNALQVKTSIESEHEARKILENLGKLSDRNNPIVLCFDQLDHSNIASVFRENTNFHNENLKNFLVVMSLVTDIYRQNIDKITQSDKARINESITLKSISLDLAEELWRVRLHPLHRRANPRPTSPIYPLNRQQLELKFPGGKTNIRNAIILGKELIDRYVGGNEFETKNPLDEFKKVWNIEFKSQKDTLRSIHNFSSFELVQMLENSLELFQVEHLNHSILGTNKQTRYSLEYQPSQTRQKMGVVWSEDANLTKFCSLMKSCQKAIAQNDFDRFYLIRSASLGKQTNKGHQIYTSIFNKANQIHIIPHLDSLYYLATYYNLLNASRVGELVIGTQVPNIEQLQDFVRQSQVLQKCLLLQELEGVMTRENREEDQPQEKMISGLESEIKPCILTILKQENFIAIGTILTKTREQIGNDSISEMQIMRMLQKLAREYPITTIGDESKIESCFAYWNPEHP
ncbi:MAG: ATP-binding protein [Cyanobacteriota bacterium]|nr:ATP-binding protein [Cyanobacteriota bacterium]